jgi:hypothetical protein
MGSHRLFGGPGQPGCDVVGLSAERSGLRNGVISLLSSVGGRDDLLRAVERAEGGAFEGGPAEGR